VQRAQHVIDRPFGHVLEAEFVLSTIPNGVVQLDSYLVWQKRMIPRGEKRAKKVLLATFAIDLEVRRGHPCWQPSRHQHFVPRERTVGETGAWKQMAFTATWHVSVTPFRSTETIEM
jgi:hypothetical protein